jgi:hypothetical protein
MHGEVAWEIVTGVPAACQTAGGLYRLIGVILVRFPVFHETSRKIPAPARIFLFSGKE